MYGRGLGSEMRTEFRFATSFMGWGLLCLIISLSHFGVLANMVMFLTTHQPVLIGSEWSEVERTWGESDETILISNDPSGVSFAKFYYRPDLLILLDENHVVKAITTGDRVIDLNYNPFVDLFIGFVISLLLILLSGHVNTKLERIALGLSMASFLWIMIFEDRLQFKFYSSGSPWMVVACLSSMALFLVALALMIISTYKHWIGER